MPRVERFPREREVGGVRSLTGRDQSLSTETAGEGDRGLGKQCRLEAALGVIGTVTRPREWMRWPGGVVV